MQESISKLPNNPFAIVREYTPKKVTDTLKDWGNIISQLCSFDETPFIPITDRNIIILTDFEPDDCKAIYTLVSAFAPSCILFIGTTVMHAGRKKALVERLLTQINLATIPVFQGTGGTPDSYQSINSTKAAKTYTREGHRILEEDELEQLNNKNHSSTELQREIQKTLEDAQDQSIEFALLAPPSDLVEVLKKFPDLKKKIKHLYVMGGWMEIPNADSTITRRTTYNWDMDIESSAALMKMQDISMTLYSSHIIKSCLGASINAQNYPQLIEKIQDCQEKLPYLQDDRVALTSWNYHVIEKIPALLKIIEPYVDHQFTPADPAVAVGMIYPQFILKERKGIKVNIDSSDQTERGSLVTIEDDPTSKINLVEDLDVELFERAMIKTYETLIT